MLRRTILSMFFLLAVTLVSGASTMAAAIDMVVWGKESQELEALVKAYKGTGVNLKFVSDAMEFQGLLINNPPDVVMGNSDTASELMKMGFYADLTTYLPDGRLLQDILPNVRKAYSRGKYTYCIPLGGRVSTLSYNKSLFTKSGLPFPDKSWRYREEYAMAVRKLSRDINGDGQNDQWGAVGYPYGDWAPLAYSFGARFFSDDLKRFLFTDKYAVETMDFINKLYKDKLVCIPEIGKNMGTGLNMLTAKPPFNDGKVGTVITDRVIYGADLDFKAGATLTPRDRNGSVAFASTMAVGMYTKSKDKKDAGRLIAYLASVDAQHALYKSTGMLPTSRKALESPKMNQLRSDVEKAVFQSFPKTQVLSIDPDYRTAVLLFQNNINQVFCGQMTVSDFMNQIRPTIEAQIDKIKSGAIKVMVK